MTFAYILLRKRENGGMDNKGAYKKKEKKEKSNRITKYKFSLLRLTVFCMTRKPV